MCLYLISRLQSIVQGSCRNGHLVISRVLLSLCIAAAGLLVHFPLVTSTNICVLLGRLARSEDLSFTVEEVATLTWLFSLVNSSPTLSELSLSMVFSYP